MRRTLDSVIAQTERPARWIIVDDGSTDESPEILAEYAARHDWITVIRRENRGHRAVGPGVIDAFYAGLDTVSLDDFTYLCKLDLDLDLPDGYFETLMSRMEADPRIGTCSGKAYYRNRHGTMVSENLGDEMSVGMTKFYSVPCFRQIGGFVREVMWDGIDCHKARQLGWTPVSWDPRIAVRASAPDGIEPPEHLYRTPPAWLRTILHGNRSDLFHRDRDPEDGLPALCAGRACHVAGLSRGVVARARTAWRRRTCAPSSGPISASFCAARPAPSPASRPNTPISGSRAERHTDQVPARAGT